jgi:hypothetical protein
MTERIKYAIIIIEVMNMIKKIKNLKLKNVYLWVLFFGLVSTLAGGAWVLMLDRFAESKNAFGVQSYPSEALNEVVFSALLHIVCGIILFLHERKKVE